jgi:hypothetical protein
MISSLDERAGVFHQAGYSSAVFHQAGVFQQSQPDENLGEIRMLLDEELNRLPDAFRGPVLLCDLEGKAHQEAAHLLGLPVGTVSSRLVRARDKLRKRLVRRGLTLSAGAVATLCAQEAAEAAVPPALVAATSRAAVAFAAGGATAAIVPASLAALAGRVGNLLLGKLYWNEGAVRYDFEGESPYGGTRDAKGQPLPPGKGTYSVLRTRDMAAQIEDHVFYGVVLKVDPPPKSLDDWGRGFHPLMGLDPWVHYAACFRPEPMTLKELASGLMMESKEDEKMIVLRLARPGDGFWSEVPGDRRGPFRRSGRVRCPRDRGRQPVHPPGVRAGRRDPGPGPPSKRRDGPGLRRARLPAPRVLAGRGEAAPGRDGGGPRARRGPAPA